MAFRFQRRIKILPGLSLNLSKSGLGLSAGVRGARMSVGSRGIHSHVGIPGTGLAYRQKHTLAQSKRVNQRSHRAALDSKAEDTVTIQADSQTGLTRYVLHSSGEEITLAIVRKLCPNIDSLLESYLTDELQKRNSLLEALRCLHHDIPHPDQHPFEVAMDFDEPAPEAPAKSQPGFIQKCWPPAMKRFMLKNQHAAIAYQEDRSAWEAREVEFEQQIELYNQHVINLHSGELSSMTGELERRFREIPWPFEPEICFDLGTDPTTIAVDVGLPDEESFPALEWRMGAGNRRLISKEISATARRVLYRDYLHSVALRLTGDVFAGLPTIDRAAISMNAPVADTQRGGTRDSCLLSMMVRRDSWRQLNFGNLEFLQPDCAVELFELRRNMTKSGMFREIDPFKLVDLDGAQ